MKRTGITLSAVSGMRTTNRHQSEDLLGRGGEAKKMVVAIEDGPKPATTEYGPGDPVVTTC